MTATPSVHSATEWWWSRKEPMRSEGSCRSASSSRSVTSHKASSMSQVSASLTPHYRSAKPSSVQVWTSLWTSSTSPPLSASPTLCQPAAGLPRKESSQRLPVIINKRRFSGSRPVPGADPPRCLKFVPSCVCFTCFRCFVEGSPKLKLCGILTFGQGARFDSMEGRVTLGKAP